MEVVVTFGRIELIPRNRAEATYLEGFSAARELEHVVVYRREVALKGGFSLVITRSDYGKSRKGG